MNIPFVDLKAQYRRIEPQINEALGRVLEHGRFIMGPEVLELEKKLAEFVESEHAVACSSGTDALLMALMAYRVGTGDAIFTTPFTFFATVEVIVLAGATPVFVDIDRETYNMDPAALEAKIEEVKREGELNVRGVIPVDLFGLPAEYDRILPIAEKHGLFVLEDAAQAYGAEYKGRKAPALAHVGATSFFPAKPLGCYGDGGAVFTDDEDTAKILRSIRVHGQSVDKHNNIRIGLNARMDSLQAAVLLEKMKIYPDELQARRRVAEMYGKRLSAVSGIRTQKIPDGCKTVWAQFCLETDKRDQVQATLREAGIPTMIYYARPSHLLDALTHLGYAEGDFPAAEALSGKIFALPFHPYLEEEQIERIVETIKQSLQQSV